MSISVLDLCALKHQCRLYALQHKFVIITIIIIINLYYYYYFYLTTTNTTTATTTVIQETTPQKINNTFPILFKIPPSPS